jgi:DNA-nicking Smr family endonuclease
MRIPPAQMDAPVQEQAMPPASSQGFGDILDAWDKYTAAPHGAKTGKKKQPAPSRAVPPASTAQTHTPAQKQATPPASSQGFGDILDAWDKYTAVPHGAKTGKKKQPASSRAVPPAPAEQRHTPAQKQATPPASPRGFGDILDAWDKYTAVPHGAKTRKKNRPEQTEQPKKVDPIIEWMRIHGVHDKDREPEAETATRERWAQLMHAKPDAIIDLHGLNREAAWKTLETFFDHSRKSGFEKVLVIHGKGNQNEGGGILKDITQRFIERCPFAGESGHSTARAGGTGSTWVLLKRTEF